MSFLEKLRDTESTIFIHTLTPPNLSNNDGELLRKIDHIGALSNEVKLDAINIPEIQNEQRNTRVTVFNPKMDPLQFAHRLISSGRETPDLILDKIVVREPWHEQIAWFDEAISHINNVVLVGGESSQITYPGPQVHEAAQLLCDRQTSEQNYSIGAITIPSRGSREVQRLLKKSSAGIEFFISQVLYESGSMITLLSDYVEALSHAEIKPAPIILSFAPISSMRDLEFMRWWDVEVPEMTAAYITSTEVEIVERSIEVCGQILQEILNYIRVENVVVPIGVNVEHVSVRNLEASIKLSTRLFEIFRSDRLS